MEPEAQLEVDEVGKGIAVGQEPSRDRAENDFVIAAPGRSRWAIAASDPASPSLMFGRGRVPVATLLSMPAIGTVIVIESSNGFSPFSSAVKRRG